MSDSEHPPKTTEKEAEKGVPIQLIMLVALIGISLLYVIFQIITGM